MRNSVLSLLFLQLASLGHAKDPRGYSYQIFKTEPEILAPKIKILEVAEDTSRISPGYIFLAPFAEPGCPQMGPHIIDQEGELVWYGNKTTRARVQNFHLCRFHEETPSHLCFSESTHTYTRAEKATARFLNNNYEWEGRGYGSSNPLGFSNPHEFNTMPDGNSFIQTVYEPKIMDLTPYAGPEKGYVLDGCFQEIDVDNGEALFTWCGLDHFPVWHTYIFLDVPGNTVNVTGESYGTGEIDHAWDYFHINAVDKNDDGDYFVSARHLDVIFKIAGNNSTSGAEPGSIIWRMGGKFNDFKKYDLVDLSRQHHVRHIKTTPHETVLTLFNNQWRSAEGGRTISNVQQITLNTNTMTVTDVKKFYQPEGEKSMAQGSMQLMDNGNSFVGWGTLPHISEFSPTGEVLFHAHIANHSTDPHLSQMLNYRSFKFNWVGYPLESPKLVAYSKGCDTSDNPLVAYVSWNGATEVRAWRFHTSAKADNGPWRSVGTYARTGFETKAYLQDANGVSAPFARYVMAEALDEHHNVLGKVISPTFVPRNGTARDCTADGCQETEYFYYDDALSRGGSCPVEEHSISIAVFIIPVLLVVAVAYALRKLVFDRSAKRAPEPIEVEKEALIDSKSWP